MKEIFPLLTFSTYQIIGHGHWDFPNSEIISNAHLTVFTFLPQPSLVLLTFVGVHPDAWQTKIEEAQTRVLHYGHYSIVITAEVQTCFGTMFDHL